MKPVVAIGLAAVIGTAISVSPATAASTRNGPPCTPSTTKINGGPAVSYCGPATATLRVGSKTYRFKGGYCQSIHVSGIKLDITLGTLAQGKSGTGAPGNAGKPYLSLDVSPGVLGSLLHGAFADGKKLTAGASVSVKGGSTSAGMFKSIKNGALTGPPFSGSWACHGAVFKA